jgi:antitoxin component YwqK of YwqJK toxin-antitoxin module
MLIARMAGFLIGISLPLTLQAKEDTSRTKLAAIKSTLVRPTIEKFPALGDRRELSSAEQELLTRRYPREIRRSVESVLERFWSLDLLKALSSAGTTSFVTTTQRQDDWLRRVDESMVFSGCGIKAPAPQERLQLTYLSLQGYKQFEDSQELTTATGRDMFAGIPAADFCEREPGNHIPVDYALRFSPWEVASHLASSSRLEATLVNLIMKPDGLSIDSDISDTNVISHETSDHHSHGWMDALDRLNGRIKLGALSLSDLANLIRRDTSIEQSVRSLVLAAAVSASPLKKDCETRGGLWSEVRWNERGWLELFACRSVDKNQIGFVLAAEEGDLAEGTVILSTVVQSLRIEGKLDADSDEFSVRYIDSSKSINSEIWFTQSGDVKAARDGDSSESRHVFFGDRGDVEWINQLRGVKTLRNISWYKNGQPRSFDVIDEGGRVTFRGGFYADGRPHYWQPYQNGKKDGALIWWFPSGARAGELEFAGGRRFGVGSVFYENGVEGFHGEYSDDQLHGRMLWRDPHGRTLFSLNYTGGKAHGLMEIRHGGRTIAEARFEGGSVEGHVLVRNRKGLVVGDIPYRAGLLNGEVILRDSTGSMRVRSPWHEGQLHGETEIWYASKVKAAYCQFDNGQLQQWGSFRPDSSFRYVGKVSSEGSGRASIDYYAGNPAPVVRCRAEDWMIDECESVHSGVRRPAPRLKDILKIWSRNDGFRFSPDKCGGYFQTFDVSPFADMVDGEVKINFRVKDACKEIGLATSIDCKASLKTGAWTVDTCKSSMIRDDEF